MNMPWIITTNGAQFSNDATKEVVTYNNLGEVESTRPYTQDEITAADAKNAVAAVESAKIEYDRAIALTAPEALEALQLAGLASEGFTNGASWRQPTGVHD